VSRGAVLTGALLATLAAPATWALALAAFLLRGGIVVVALPVLVLPTPVGLGNVVGPTLTSIALGAPPIEVAVVGGLIGVGIIVWVVVGGWLAAGLEAAGVRIVARDEDVLALVGSVRPVSAPVSAPSSGSSPEASAGPDEGLIATRILAARLVASVPLILALGWGSVRIVFAAYRELTSPSDVAMPIAMRVLRATPEVVVAVGLAWMAGEIVGAVAARRIAMAGEGTLRALRGAVATSIRHPLSTAARFWLPTFALLAVLLPSALATASAWGAVRAVLGGRADPFSVLLAVVLFVVLWMVGLLLAAVVCAWRAAVWTVAEAVGEGTFGGSANRRPGDWRPDPSSANL
jgi:hypothetical protein